MKPVTRRPAGHHRKEHLGRDGRAGDRGRARSRRRATLIRHSLLKISRVRLGGLSFEGLKMGGWRDLTQGRDRRPAPTAPAWPDAPRDSSRQAWHRPDATPDVCDRTPAVATKIAKIARALISVSDKTGVVELARGCPAAGLEILSTGGTARGAAPRPAFRCARSATSPARPRSSTAGSRRCTRASTAASSAAPTDGAPRGDAGGRHRPDRPGGRQPVPVPRDGRARRAVRRGDREHRHRRAGDDALGGQEPRAGRGGRRSGRLRRACWPSSTRPARSRRRLRFRLARKAFAHTAAYDGAIAVAPGPARRRPTRRRPTSPRRCTSAAALARALRYGENPHQKAAFYALDGRAAARRWRAARGAAGQGAVLQQHPRPRRGAAAVRRVRRAGGGDRQAQQPVRRGGRRTRASRTPTGARARPIRCRRSAASSRSTARSTASWRASWPRPSSSA